MLEELTIPQRKAVVDRGGDLLVSAAAGSGKTKVLVERLMQCINDPISPANIDDFLIITYTKAAASELRSKIAKALTQRITENPANMHLQRQFQRLYLAKISTVHAFCSDVLREYSYMLDIASDFRMIDEQEDYTLRCEILDRILLEAYNAIGDDPDLFAFVDSQGIGRNDNDLPGLILRVYDSANRHMDPELWLNNCIQAYGTEDIFDASETIWGKYLINHLMGKLDLHIEAVCKAANACECSDGLEKLGEHMHDIANQMIQLRKAQNWDEIHQRIQLDFGDLRKVGVKKTADKEIYDATKVVREFCMKEMQSLAKDFGNDNNRILSDLKTIQPAVRGLIGLVERFTKEYAQTKKALRLMDFSDLEHKALDLLLGKTRNGPTAVAKQVGSRFCQIMVDEYQDSNEVQDALFSALSKGRNNLFMVGDVKQSIYQFRLADPTLFLEKYAKFPSADEAIIGQGRKIVLSNNFRSGPEVIEAVNSVFQRCMSPEVGGLRYGDEEALWEGIPKSRLPDHAVSLRVIDVEKDSGVEEAEYVADQISILLDGKHFVRDGEQLRVIQPEDVAILLRSPKTNGGAFHTALQKRGIGTVSSHSINLLKTDEVEWLRSLLHTINNPRQDIPLIATVTGPVFGFNADDLAAIRIHAPKGCFYDAMKATESPKVSDFLAILSRLRRMARFRSLPQLIEEIFTLTKADVIYSSFEDGDVRNGNLQEFYRFVVKYSATQGTELSQMLHYLEQCETEGISVEQKHSTAGCVQITSIHKSKGLEYPVVFLCCLSRAINTRSTHGTLLCDSSLGLGLSCVEHGVRIRYPSIANNAISRKLRNDGISEELRVLYVAMTRPKDRLYMTYAGTNISKTLKAYSYRLDFCDHGLLYSRVSSLGDWVLYTALQRTEAGALFHVGRKPECSAVSNIPWEMMYFQSHAVEQERVIAEEAEHRTLDESAVIRMKEALSFRYQHNAATRFPSKQTATQIKGRIKDHEVQEYAPYSKHQVRSWPIPTLEAERLRRRERGTITHLVMQYLNLRKCTSEEEINSQLQLLKQQGRITEEQIQIVDTKKLALFFKSDLGCRVRNADHVLREFKFSILEDANFFAPDIHEEKVLLQGVVDCAIVEPDSITVIDFKTDRVTDEKLQDTVAKYQLQIETYARALSRIFELPIKEKVLYFFEIDKGVSI